MRLSELPLDQLGFRTSDGVMGELQRACNANPDIASFEVIGRSRGGRPIAGVILGNGPRVVSLIAGNHADEPVGPETLRTIILETLGHRDWLADGDGFIELFERFTFRIVPHANPDGEEANQTWIQQWPDVVAFLRHRVREAPGDDLEFGFPVMRPENRAVSRFLFDYQPLALHMSLHGIAFAEGALLLLDRHRLDDVSGLMRQWSEAVRAVGLQLHDHDRGGEKGFLYFGPGFWSTPEGEAMRRHFHEAGDLDTAQQFFLSSMEMARIAGYDAVRKQHPLVMVTELPLFVVGKHYECEPGVPRAMIDFHRAIEDANTDEAIRRLASDYQITHLDLTMAVRLQLQAIEMALAVL